MSSKRRIAEQVQRILGGDVLIQELMLYCNQAYGYIVKKNWWNNKAQGENDVNGNFIYSFDDNVIALDTAKNLYYSQLPSSFLGDIPHEMGIPHVSYMQSYDKPFVRLANGMPGLFRGLDSATLDGNDTFFVENAKIYLPTITAQTSGKNLLIKLVVALEGISDEENIAIPPDVEFEIVQLAVAMYSQENTGVKSEAQGKQG